LNFRWYLGIENYFAPVVNFGKNYWSCWSRLTVSIVNDYCLVRALTATIASLSYCLVRASKEKSFANFGSTKMASMACWLKMNSDSSFDRPVNQD
jgi:hypothetical protein